MNFKVNIQIVLIFFIAKKYTPELRYDLIIIVITKNSTVLT